MIKKIKAKFNLTFKKIYKMKSDNYIKYQFKTLNKNKIFVILIKI